MNLSIIVLIRPFCFVFFYTWNITAMKILGLGEKDFNQNPQLDENDKIGFKVFVSEAYVQIVYVNIMNNVLIFLKLTNIGYS